MSNNTSNRVAKVLAAAVLPIVGFAYSANAQIIGQPCETCGIALGAPLPEGVFFLDNESYGGRDGQNNRLGVNEPTLIWSTPFSAYNTRLEFILPDPIFTHIDGATVNRVDAYTQAAIVVLAHDFGNGFNLGVAAGTNTADRFTNNGRGENAQFRVSASYVKDGYNLTVTGNYFGDFGGKLTTVNGVLTGFDDNVFIDYTFTKKFNKFELGVIGTYETDINGPVVRQRSLAIGGLVGYDFGKFTLQAYATREVYVRNGGWGLGQPGLGAGGLVANPSSDYETRGSVRIVVPLYVAPTAPAPITARY